MDTNLNDPSDGGHGRLSSDGGLISHGALSGPGALSGTKLQIVEAALETLKVNGFAGASARGIAHSGGFNQALIFYHFGSVQNALLASLDLISARRLAEYGPAFEAAQTPTELARLARVIYDEDRERGYVTALGEMVSGGVSDPLLGAEVAARIEPWIEMVERKLEQFFERVPLPLRALVPMPAKDLAFGIVSAYFGVDMLSHMQRDHNRAESLLDLADRLATLLETVLPPTVLPPTT
jgi:AcrR family transcriptional regulator